MAPKAVLSRSGYITTLSIQARSESQTLGEALAGFAQQLLRVAESISVNGFDRTHPAKVLKRVVQLLKLVRLGLTEDSRRAGVRLARRVNQLLLNINDQHNAQGAHYTPAQAIVESDIKRLVESLRGVADGLIQLELGDAAGYKNVRHLKAARRWNGERHDVELNRLALTRSGSLIAALSSKKRLLAVYKEGQRSKLQEEIEGVELWRKTAPTVVPKLLAEHNDEHGASLLIEHLPGQTLESLVLENNVQTLDALEVLFNRLRKIWRATHTEVPTQPHFMAQLKRRLPECQHLHPDLFQAHHNLAGWHRPGLEELAESIEASEHLWQSPCSVLTHGDFNLDNILFDRSSRQVFFIDLHRSGYHDWVQDLSTLMISIYRLPNNVKHTETTYFRLQLAQYIYAAGRRFAKRHSDKHFDARLACGLARGFATSTRFIADSKKARDMVLRSRYLLETLTSLNQRKIAHYRVPVNRLYAK